LEEQNLEKYASRDHVSPANILVGGFSFEYHRVSKNKNWWKIGRFFLRLGLYIQKKVKMRNQRKWEKIKHLENQSWSDQMQPIITLSTCISIYWHQVCETQKKKILVQICGILSQEKIWKKILDNHISGNMRQTFRTFR